MPPLAVILTLVLFPGEALARRIDTWEEKHGVGHCGKSPRRPKEQSACRLLFPGLLVA